MPEKNSYIAAVDIGTTLTRVLIAEIVSNDDFKILGVGEALNTGIKKGIVESITKAAGASHGQETHPAVMLKMIESAGRTPRLRNTLYGSIDSERLSIALKAKSVEPIVNNMNPVISKRDGKGVPYKKLVKNFPVNRHQENG